MKDVDKLCEEDIIFIEHLYRKYSKRIYSVCGRFIHEPMDREDLVSIVLLALMSKSDKLQSLLPFEQERYITKATITACFNFLRKRKLIWGREISVENMNFRGYDTNSDLAEHIQLQEELNTVLLAIMQLPEKERECIKLKYLYNKTDEEVATITHLSINSIPKYIQRSREHMRVLYAQAKEESHE